MPTARHRTDLRNLPSPNLNIPASQQEAVERRHALDQQLRDYRAEPNGPANHDQPPARLRTGTRRRP